MQTIKPTNFPLKPNLIGDEELYSQTSGQNSKFTVQKIWDGVTQQNINVTSGDTIINNDTINISGGTTLVSGGTVNIPSGTTLQSGSTSVVTNNGDGTYTHSDGKVPATEVVIKPQNYSTSENKTGEQWIDGKDVYRLVVELPQWTLPSDESGSALLGTGQTFDTLIRMNFFAKEDGGNTIKNLNIGDGKTWSGAAGLTFDGSDSYIEWDNMYTPSDISTNTPLVTVIIEYTKP